MATRILAAFLGASLSAGWIGAADIGGSVVVVRKLTRRNITAPAPTYQRGVAVPLEPKPAEDPLMLERSHVVVYIDAPGSSSGPFSGPASGRIIAEIQQQDRQFSPDLVVVPWCVRDSADGHFVLPVVPPGKYTVVAWHKAAGFFRKTVTVAENGAPPITFDIPLTEAGQKAVAHR